MTPRSIKAIENIRKICEENLQGRYELEVIDIYQQPEYAKKEQILAAPTLIKKLPLPLRRFIGDMSDKEKILIGLNLVPKKDTEKNNIRRLEMQKKANRRFNAESSRATRPLEEAQETLDAIRRGEVDGLVVSTPKGEQVYTISGAEKPYRALIEEMREGAVMLSDDNTILYCNSGFAKMMRRSSEKIVGAKIESIVSPTHLLALRKLLTLARTQKSAVTKEITLQANGDIVVPTLMSINSLKSDTLNNTFLVATDLTEHMEEEVKRYTNELELAQIALSESEQRWATTLASIGDSVIATNLLGKIKFMNGVAETNRLDYG